MVQITLCQSEINCVQNPQKLFQTKYDIVPNKILIRTKQNSTPCQTKYYSVPNTARIVPTQTGHFAALLLPALAPYILAGPELFPFINQVFRFQIKFLKHMTNNTLIKSEKKVAPYILAGPELFPFINQVFRFHPRFLLNSVTKVSKM